jgi:hypothetical protein
LYVPRKQGGRGLKQLEEAYIIEIAKLMEYVDSSEDPIIRIVRTHQKNINSAMVHTARSLKRELQKGTRQRTAWQRIQKKGGGEKGCMDSFHVTTKNWWIMKSYQWLKFGNIEGEIESTIVAAQDQAISTNYFKNKILKEEVDSKCRLCKQHEETIDHLTSGCPILVKNEYLMRHDKVGAHLHYSICKALSIETTNGIHTHTQTSMWS